MTWSCRDFVSWHAPTMRQRSPPTCRRPGATMLAFCPIWRARVRPLLSRAHVRPLLLRRGPDEWMANMRYGLLIWTLICWLGWIVPAHAETPEEREALAYLQR